jgi:hypothetical protein
MVSIIILYMEIIYYNGGKINGQLEPRRSRLRRS